LWIEGSGASSAIAMKASYDLHLPVATGMLSRTSRAQAFKMVQLLSNDLIDKPIIKEYNNEKPLLLITTDETKTEQEKKLISRADSLFKIDNKTFYKLPLKVFATAFPPSLGNQIGLQWKRRGDILTNDSINPIVYLPALQVTNAHDTIIYFDSPLNQVQDSVEMEASLWMEIDNPFMGFPLFRMELQDEKGKIIFQQEVAPKFVCDLADEELRISFKFNISSTNRHLKIYSLGPKPRVRNLLIKPLKSDVFFGSDRWYDNYPTYP
jgi:hypothetical protein